MDKWVKLKIALTIEAFVLIGMLVIMVSNVSRGWIVVPIIAGVLVGICLLWVRTIEP